MTPDDLARTLSKHLADEGKLIEAGWVVMEGIMIPKNTPPSQLFDMRMAYMAGAQHLYASIMGILDPGDEPTDADMHRMELIHNELEAWRKEMKKLQGSS